MVAGRALRSEPLFLYNFAPEHVEPSFSRRSRSGNRTHPIHYKERPFYKDLVGFMTSGPVVVQVLEGDNAIARNRDLMGATNPKEAAAGSIRADFAESIDANAVHGSDSPESAAREVAYFFQASEICSR